MHKDQQDPHHLHLQRQVQPEAEEPPELHRGPSFLQTHQGPDPQAHAQDCQRRGDRNERSGDGGADRDVQQRHPPDHQPAADAPPHQAVLRFRRRQVPRQEGCRHGPVHRDGQAHEPRRRGADRHRAAQPRVPGLRHHTAVHPGELPALQAVRRQERDGTAGARRQGGHLHLPRRRHEQVRSDETELGAHALRQHGVVGHAREHDARRSRGLPRVRAQLQQVPRLARQELLRW